MSSSTKQLVIAVLSFIFFITLIIVLYVDMGRKNASHEESGKSDSHTTTTAAPTTGSSETTPASSPQPKLLAEFGCVGCHSLDGSSSVGPSLKGIYNKKVTVVSQGAEKEVLRDDEYFKRAVFSPNEEVVKGFQPMMPSSQGMVTEAQLHDLIEEIKKI